MSSKEVESAIGAAPEKESAAVRLEQKREELAQAEAKLAKAEQAMDAAAVVRLRDTVGVLRQFVGTLEQETRAEGEARGVALARERMVAIEEIHAVVRNQLAKAAKRVIEAAEVYEALAVTVNALWAGLTQHEREAEALGARFGLEPPDLPRVKVPEIHPDCVTAFERVRAVGFAGPQLYIPHTEEDGSVLRRQRRDFVEINGTPAYEIIQAVGLRPWPELTPRQRELLAQDEANKTRSHTELREMGVEVLKASVGERILGAKT